MNINYIIELSYIVNEVDKYYEIINKSKNLEDLQNMYKKIKDISNLFYIDGKINSYYNLVLKIINKCELLFDDKYLIDTGFILKKCSINSSSDELEILDYVVNKTRENLLKCKKN